MIKGSNKNHLQSTLQKTKDRVTRTSLISGGELMCSINAKKFLLH